MREFLVFLWGQESLRKERGICNCANVRGLCNCANVTGLCNCTNFITEVNLNENENDLTTLKLFSKQK